MLLNGNWRSLPLEKKKHLYDRLREKREALQPSNTQWTPHAPTARQKLFLEDLHDVNEAFYGGAAGGGKSDALLAAALEYVSTPGYAALILRRTYQDLAKPGAIMDRAHQWLSGTPAKWNEQKKQWRFPSGAVLTFGYLENENDKYQYQSAEYQFVALDELTQFSESQYLYMFSRLRRLKDVEIPLRMRSASNPGGIGAEWVKQRFIPDDFLPRDAVEPRIWQKTTVDDLEQEIHTYFVPARITDNPHLDQQTYAGNLARLDKVTREQLLHGDWTITATGRSFFNLQAVGMFRAETPQLGGIEYRKNDFGESLPFFNEHPSGLLALWRRPKAGRFYCIGCDTASGRDANRGEGKVDSDWSVATVIDIESGELCARFRGQISERHFGEVWARLSEYYNDAYVVPAVTGGYGTAALNSAVDNGLSYNLIYCREDESGYKKRVNPVDFGFVETNATRPTLYSNLDSCLIDGSITVYDAVTVNELHTFERNKDGKPEARAGCKDDCVTALALAAKGFDSAPRERRQEKPKPNQIRKYGQQPKPDDDAAWWARAMRG